LREGRTAVGGNGLRTRQEPATGRNGTPDGPRGRAGGKRARAAAKRETAVTRKGDTLTRTLTDSLRRLATDEGKQAAVAVAERLQSSLETIAEAGSKQEAAFAGHLLHVVNATLSDLVKL